MAVPCIEHDIIASLQQLKAEGDDLSHVLKDYHTTQSCSGVTDTYFDTYLRFVVQQLQPFYQKHPELYQEIRDKFYPNCEIDMSHFTAGLPPTTEEIATLIKVTDECYIPWCLFVDHMTKDGAIIDIDAIDHEFLTMHPHVIWLLQNNN